MDSHDGRVAGPPPRRGGLLGSPLLWVTAVAVVLVAAVAAVTQLAGRPAGGDPSPDASATTAPSASVPGSSVGDSAAPSATAAPSEAADAGELVLRLKFLGGTYFGPDVMPEFTLTADGTVVWLPNPASGELPGLLTRQLTADGLAEIRGRIFAGGLLDETATHELERRPDAGEPPGHGVGIYTFTADDGEGEAVVVTSVQWLGEEEESTYYQPAPEREALDALAQQLRDPESLVSDDAWVDTAAAYEATDYQLVLRLMPNFPPYDTTDASEIPWPVDGPLNEFGEQSGQVTEARCGTITAEEAGPIVEAIEASGSPAGMAMVTTASLDWAESNGVVDVFLIPRMPDGYAECTDLP